MVVHKLSLGCGQLEQLREHCIDSNILWLPCIFPIGKVLQFIKRSGTLNKSAVGEIAIQVHQIASRHITVEVQDVDRVKKAIANKGCSDVSHSWDRRDLLLR